MLELKKILRNFQFTMIMIDFPDLSYFKLSLILKAAYLCNLAV